MNMGNMKPSNHSSQFPPSRGWTLVELLVAMALGLLIIAGIGQIYLAAKRSYDIQTSIARIQDVGRFATELLTQDIRQAGYWGLLNMEHASLAGKLTGNVAPDNTCVSGNTSWGSMVEERIFGLDDKSPTNPPPGTYSCIDGSWHQGDVLAIRYGDPTTVTPYPNNSLYINAHSLKGTIALGPDGTTPPIPPTPNPSFDYELVAHVYYVRNNAVNTDCGSSSVPVPELARKELNSSGMPSMAEGLVTGVEWLEFQYGVDTNDNGSVNRYLNAHQVDTWNSPTYTFAQNWNAVRSVRFWVLVRDDCPEGGYTDTNTYNMGNESFTPSGSDAHFRRSLYSSTVTLRSSSK
jgi:type IV pilus assembly protein PilW